MGTIEYPFPIATRISISKKRRISLPKFLDVPMPFVLLETKQADQLWLGMCSLDSLEVLSAGCSSVRVLAEFRTHQPTIPKSVCDRHRLLDHTNIWLVTTKSWIEVWPDSAWQNHFSVSCVLGNWFAEHQSNALNIQQIPSDLDDG